MEQHVFQKARTREEYLALVARLIIHVREIKTKGQVDPKFGPGGPGGPPVQAGLPMQSPMDALRSLTSAGPGTNAPQQPGMPGMMAGQMQAVPQAPFQTYPQRSQMPQHQGQMPQMVRMPPGGGMPGMRPDFSMHQVPTGPPQQPPPPQFPVAMSQAQAMGSGQFMSVDSMQALTQHGQSMTQTTFGTMGQSTVMTSAPSTGQQRPQMTTQIISQPISQPTNTVSGIDSTPSLSMVHSPITILPVPSPSQTLVAQSPASRQYGGAPSPGGGLTAPSSLGPAPSPASSANEEQAYLAKWKQLQMYIEPLKRMINRMAKDEDRKNMNKMKNLLDILSDSSKRVSMSALLKCEQVLRQMDPKPAPYSLPSKGEDTHMCQTLLDAVVSQIKSPMLNHTLHRTFGPAVQALHGAPIRVPSPPPKRLKSNEDSKDNIEIPNLLQGEVARLDERFLVTLHQQHHIGSKTIQLLCHLKDKNLPSVPAINVTVPEDYPQTSPTCDTDMEEYNTTPFLQKVQKYLGAQLLQLPDKYALSALVGAWEMSVRKACNPAVL